MSIIPPSLVKVYLDQLNYSSADLDEEALTTLSQEIDYRLRELIQDASKYMVHSKRHKLTVDDLNAALRDRNQPQLYGYDPMDQLVFRAVPNSDIFYVPGEEVSLIDILQEPLPKAPLPPALTCHPLAIEGVQPAIPENPFIQREKVDLGPASSVASPNTTTNTKRKELSDEAEVKPLVKHVLPKELQLFFSMLITELMSFDSKPETSMAALKTLESDAGLQQLLPYLLQFIAEQVPKNLRSAPKLLLLMRAVVAILKNSFLFVEPYLHQLMPPVLTCLVGKRLSDDPSDKAHWEVREEAAGIIAAICSTYGSVYSSLVPRIAKTLLKALLDSEKPLTTHFGAISGIAALGPQAIDSLLLPHLEPYWVALANTAGSEEKEKVQVILQRCAQLWHAAFDQLAATSPRIVERRDLLNRLFGQMMTD